MTDERTVRNEPAHPERGQGSVLHCAWGLSRRAAALATLLFLLAAPALAKKLPAKPIDLNRATLQQLEELPGVGPSMAHRILRFREKSGPFERVEDLLAIRGIGEKRFEEIRPYVFVAPPPKRKKGKRASSSS